MHLLIIDNAPVSSLFLEALRRNEGFVVDVATSVEEGIELAQSFEHEVLIIEPALGEGEIIKQLRRMGVTTPIIVLTRIQTEAAEVAALNLGADDYLKKPVGPIRLAAHVRAVARRPFGHTESVITVGGLSIDISRRLVEVAGERVHVAHNQWTVLEHLALRKGRPVTRDALFTSLYGDRDGLDFDSRIVDTHVTRLRKCLAPDRRHDAYIQSVRGVGYMLSLPQHAVNMSV